MKTLWTNISLHWFALLPPIDFLFLCLRLLSPLTMDEFGWNKKEVLLYNNLIYAGLSIITITVLNTIKYVTRRSALLLLLFCVCMFVCFSVVFVLFLKTV